MSLSLRTGDPLSPTDRARSDAQRAGIDVAAPLRAADLTNRMAARPRSTANER